MKQEEKTVCIVEVRTDMKNKAIKIYLIAGFLGAGKTTFLNRLLSEFSNKKVGVLVNEFGSVGVDGMLIHGDGLQMTELNNGSIFCSCLRANFTKALVEISKTDIEYLFIESTGMGDPVNMHTLLKNLEKYVERPYMFKETIGLVDSVNFLEYVDTFPAIENQVLFSDLILINKSDLVTKEVLEETYKKVKSINEKAKILNTEYAAIPMSIFYQEPVGTKLGGDTTNKPRNRMSTYTVKSQSICKKEEIQKFLDLWKEKAIRIKGFFKGENGCLQVSVVGEMQKITDFSTMPFDENVVVIIGKDQREFLEEVRVGWEVCFGETPYIDTKFKA
ncbi:CobW family GTP-binding protein [uncultured Ilyobacter sp.]|uniref:CobW family GTP-binding protein n=1 Tax=uncultured Ilyobacter sp. TaxID=544433 RepID=UPI0037492268